MAKEHGPYMDEIREGEGNSRRKCGSGAGRWRTAHRSPGEYRSAGDNFENIAAVATQLFNYLRYKPDGWN